MGFAFRRDGKRAVSVLLLTHAAGPALTNLEPIVADAEPCDPPGAGTACADCCACFCRVCFAGAAGTCVTLSARNILCPMWRGSFSGSASGVEPQHGYAELCDAFVPEHRVPIVAVRFGEATSSAPTFPYESLEVLCKGRPQCRIYSQNRRFAVLDRPRAILETRGGYRFAAVPRF